MYKVVVVEDEKRVRQGIIMGTDWSKINCVVMGEAANGEEGVEMIRKCRPDIVITDIRMPKMMGIEMIENVYEDGLEPYVIFLTAYDDFAYAQQAIKLGVADYLLKPFKDGELENTIGRIIEKNRSAGNSRIRSFGWIWGTRANTLWTPLPMWMKTMPIPIFPLRRWRTVWESARDT